MGFGVWVLLYSIFPLITFYYLSNCYMVQFLCSLCLECVIFFHWSILYSWNSKSYKFHLSPPPPHIRRHLPSHSDQILQLIMLPSQLTLGSNNKFTKLPSNRTVSLLSFIRPTPDEEHLCQKKQARGNSSWNGSEPSLFLCQVLLLLLGVGFHLKGFPCLVKRGVLRASWEFFGGKVIT